SPEIDPRSSILDLHPFTLSPCHLVILSLPPLSRFDRLLRRRRAPHLRPIVLRPELRLFARHGLRIEDRGSRIVAIIRLFDLRSSIFDLRSSRQASRSRMVASKPRPVGS